VLCFWYTVLQVGMPEHSCAFDSELDQYSMNIEAKEIHAVLSIVQEISPQKSYILISTNFFFECEKKKWATICRFVSAKLCFVLQCVCVCVCVCEVTMAANWKNLPPLCTCKPSFRTVHVIFYGINKYPNRENELSKSSSNLNVYIF